MFKKAVGVMEQMIDGEYLLMESQLFQIFRDVIKRIEYGTQ